MRKNLFCSEHKNVGQLYYQDLCGDVLIYRCKICDRILSLWPHKGICCDSTKNKEILV